MFKKEHFKTKVIVGAVCVLAAVAVYLLYVPPRPDITSFYGLDLIVIWYPLTSLLYGAAVMLACRRDYGYAALMGALHLVIAILNTVVRDFAELPAAFVYTGIAAASAVLVWLIMLLCRVVVNSYRLYKEKSGGANKA